MTCSLMQPAVAAVLEREHGAAAEQRRNRPPRGEGAPSPAREDFRTSEFFRTSYLSVGPEQGRFLYIAARATAARRIVEFGSSFGVSTLYLAAAARDTGGRVTGSEYHEEKAARAEANLREAGLADVAEIRRGDALSTLAGLDGPVDLLFLDGAKDLYLPVLKLLEPKLRPGSLVIADNVDMLGDEKGGFLDHISNGGGRYVTSMIRFERSGFSQSVVA